MNKLNQIIDRAMNLLGLPFAPALYIPTCLTVFVGHWEMVKIAEHMIRYRSPHSEPCRGAIPEPSN